ncbi:MAG: aminoglycoside phosphotransferase family protein [Hyphomicrobiales bacterium]
MRSGWQEITPRAISDNQISHMCQMVFGDATYKTATPLTNGRSHQNLLITLNSGIHVVLRISAHRKNLEKQYNIAEKLWRKLPVPRFLSAPQEANGKKYFAFLEFKRGELLANIETLSTADQAQLGFELGEYLALLHSQKFKQAGELNSQLKITEAYDMAPSGICKYFELFLDKATAFERIDKNTAQQYKQVFSEKIQIINQWKHNHCLIHADLNEDNILQFGGNISGILDWEFVMSGHPAFDFGKFTRTPYFNCPIFLENLCDSYYLTHKSLPVNWDDIARIVDILAWAEFLSRPQLHDDVKASALQKLNITLGGG